ncbi:MAG: YceI family protein [Hydrogenophaga sp.]|jgi:polyisoprenoid-binding protein YceI|nr:YceI family protein [Hydrogenophaga sp.]
MIPSAAFRSIADPGRLWRAALGALLLGAATLASVPAQAQAARYEIDPDHLTVAFLVDHIGYAKVLGMFRSARGSYRFDEATATLSDVRIEVETASVFSNQRKRDDHLKGPDFLNSSEFPRMVFTAGSAQRKGDRQFEINGQLEVLGKSLPLTLQATWNKSAESPLGGVGGKPYVMGVSARGSFKRSAYGMNYAVANGWVGDEVELIIELEAVRK